MTRFKKELIKRNVMLEETLPCLPFGHVEAITVHSDTCIVSKYDNRVGWYFEEYDRQMKVKYAWDEDDYNGDGSINKVLVNRTY